MTIYSQMMKRMGPTLNCCRWHGCGSRNSRHKNYVQHNGKLKEVQLQDQDKNMLTFMNRPVHRPVQGLARMIYLFDGICSLNTCTTCKLCSSAECS